MSHPRPAGTPTLPAEPPRPSGLTAPGPGEPRRAGAFRSAGRLGVGGMGAAHAALDDKVRRVAVKQVHPPFADDEEFRARFTRGVVVLRRVRAACVPAFVGADTRTDVAWPATEYVPGPTLREHRRHRGPSTGPPWTRSRSVLPRRWWRSTRPEWCTVSAHRGT